MFDFSSTQFTRSLTETVAWCAAHSLTAHVEEPPVIRHRRALVEESQRLFREAFERMNRNWVQVRTTQEWHRSIALLKEADPLSLSLLDAQLRSATLKPSLGLDEFGTDAPWAEAVVEVVAKRSQLMGGPSSASFAGVEARGKLLLFVPSQTLMDGAAKYRSNGFFDVNNVPPWDTWVDFSERTLVSRVPPVLVEAAQQGIDANPEACIRWAD
jgi:hypothetical protein